MIQASIGFDDAEHLPDPLRTDLGQGLHIGILENVEQNFDKCFPLFIIHTPDPFCNSGIQEKALIGHGFQFDEMVPFHFPGSHQMLCEAAAFRTAYYLISFRLLQQHANDGILRNKCPDPVLDLKIGRLGHDPGFKSRSVKIVDGTDPLLQARFAESPCIDGQIANICQPNAMMTLKEFLMDYTSPETKAKGDALIEEKLSLIPNEKVRDICREHLKDIENGNRDFRF